MSEDVRSAKTEVDLVEEFLNKGGSVKVIKSDGTKNDKILEAKESMARNKGKWATSI